MDSPGPWARLEVVQELGGGFPEVFPEIIGADDAKLGEVVGVFLKPGSAGALEPGLKNMPVAGFDKAAAYRQLCLNGAWIIDAIKPVAQIAMAATHRREVLGVFFGFEVRLQHLEHQVCRAPFEPVLLRFEPPLGCFWTAVFRGSGEIFAQVKEVDEEAALFSKNLLALKANPFGSVANDVDVVGERVWGE